MSRPTTLLKDNALKWVIRLYDSSQVLVDGDSDPTISIRKNGSSTAEIATVTKRAATTGIYDCEYDPSGEVEGDQFTIEESVAISSTTYENSWSVYVQESERGTDSALLAASSPANFGDLAITATTGKVTVGTNDDKTGYSISGTKTTLDALNDVAATDVVSNGAIDTLSGAVVNVDTVDTTTTNTDMFDPSTQSVDVGKIFGSATSASRLSLSAGQIIPGTVDATVTPTTTTFEADDITEATDDHYNGRIIIFTSGALAGQAATVEDYTLNGANGSFSVSTLTEAPSDNDTFVIV